VSVAVDTVVKLPEKYGPAGAAQFNPVAVVLSAVRIVLFAPTARRETASAAVAAMMSPFASTIVLAIAAFAFVSICVSTPCNATSKSAGRSVTKSVGVGKTKP